ncbi:MAG: hypothetical protein JNK46_20110 [Methylobacteriaceae bacterium]|nr:hypothetical protein [Methylobacteriaceae bacterium]
MTAPLYDPARETYDAATQARIDALLVGVVDPHVHTGPSIATRALDHLEYAQDASKAGFAAVVTKDHDYAGVMTAWMIHKHHPELTTKVYSSIVLNNVVGGLNPYAVEHTAAMGGKICWLPTLTAENHLRWEKKAGWVHPATTTKIRPASAVPVTDANGALLDATKEIIDICARADMALASGHLHVSETWKIFEEGKRRGLKRMIVTHPEEIVDASLNDVKGLAAMGAFIEHSVGFFLEGSKFKVAEAADLVRQIEAAGVDSTILASDLGQAGKGSFHPIEGFRRAIKICIDAGYSDEAIRKMTSTNAARAIGVEADVAAARARA